MVQVNLVMSSVVLGLFVVAIVLAVSRLRSRGYAYDGGAASEVTVQDVLSSPTTWIVGFFALVAVALGGAVLYVSGAQVPVPGGAGLWLAGLLGTITGCYFVWGVYHSSRYKGLHRPAALAVTAWMVGMVVVGIVVLQLLGML